MRNALPIFLIVVVVGLFYQYIMPEYKQIVELQTERDGYDEVLAKADELRIIREELEQKVSRFSDEDLEKLEKMLPGEMDLVRLVLEVDNIALKNGIVIREIQAEEKDEKLPQSGSGEPLSPKKFQTLSLSFQFKTGYANLIKFIPKIESSLRIMDIVSIKLTSDEEQRSVQNYQMTIDTYWVK